MEETKNIKIIDIEGQKINLKFDRFFGWRIIHPIKDESGKINWINLLFGGKKNLVVLIIYLLIAVAVFMMFKEFSMNCQQFIDYYYAHQINPLG